MAGRCASLTTVILVMVLALLGSTAAFSNDDAEWLTDLDEALKRARAEGKLICLFMHDKSEETTKMQKSLDSDPVLKNLLDDYFVRVRVSRNDPIRELKILRPRTFPSLVLLSARRRPLKQLDGYFKPEDVARQMMIVLSGYRKQRPLGKNGGLKRSSVEEVEKHHHIETCPLLCPTCEVMRVKALAYLSGAQRPGGYYTCRSPKVKDIETSTHNIDVTLTSLAVLAFRSEGSTVETGRYAANIERGVNWLAKKARRDGEFCQKNTDQIIYQTYTNFHTSFAAWALSETTDTKAHRKILARAARYLEKQQDEKTGGWGYNKFWKSYGRGTSWGWACIAPTHLAVTVLELLDNMGIEVDPEVVRRGMQYVTKCRGPSGGFAYRPAYRGMEYPGSTASALVSAYVIGSEWDDEWYRSQRYLRFNLSNIGNFRSEEFLNYFHLFTALASILASREDYQDYWKLYRDTFVDEQNKDGSWDDLVGGKVYGTAIRLIVTQLPRENLTLQKKTLKKPAAEDYFHAEPTYRKSARNRSQHKVFDIEKKSAPWEKYGLDLVVRIDGPYSSKREETLRNLFIGVAEVFYDLTDGQFRLNKVELTWLPVKKPDIVFTSDTHAGTGGIAHTMKKLVNGVETSIVEKDVVLKLESSGWRLRSGAGTVAHELSHYFFGMPDEYLLDSGEATCSGCIMSGSFRGLSEYCTGRSHKDSRYRLSCWELVKEFYPKVEMPENPDPGPHICPPPVVDVLR